MRLRDDLAAGRQNANRATLRTVAADALTYRENFIGKPNGMRPQSHLNDVRNLNTHTIPHLGDKQIHKITVGDINMFIDKLHIEASRQSHSATSSTL